MSRRPKLLVLELWGVGDLAVATPFLRAAAEKFAVTLLAKPHALALQPRLWPNVEVLTLDAPWTAFRGKYQLTHWPWRELAALRRRLVGAQFDFGVSARHDPRDHFFLWLTGTRHTIGLPRLASAMWLTQPLPAPHAAPHRYDVWRQLAQPLGLELPAREKLSLPEPPGKNLLLHSGARLDARVWPLDRYQQLAARLRAAGYPVQIVCDERQEKWWREHGEANVAAPRSLAELFALLDHAAAFIGNCSGPGHLAAVSGVPTFTIFGPSQPGEFLPVHPRAEFIEDHSCPHKPCADYCRFNSPRCLENLSLETVARRVEEFCARLVK
ncbi:MAG: hypothetical protein RL380_598 [Verrucomicrobiota bacterium]|jgi:heptosyltransferase-2